MEGKQLTFTLIEPLKPADGVPDKTPVLVLNVILGGRAPVAANVNGGVPPPATQAKEAACVATPVSVPGQARVSRLLTRRVQHFCTDVTGGVTPLSCTVKQGLNEPVVDGVPAKTPLAEMVNVPGGKLVRLPHVKGPKPPFTVS
jgi:hypothetical protein